MDATWKLQIEEMKLWILWMHEIYGCYGYTKAIDAMGATWTLHMVLCGIEVMEIRTAHKTQFSLAKSQC